MPLHCLLRPCIGVDISRLGAGTTARGAGEPHRPNFDIASQPLAQALTAFGRQSGMQIAVDSGGCRRQDERGSVNGTMTAEQALRQLLAGTGLTYQFTSANAVTVVRPGRPDRAPCSSIPCRCRASAAPPQARSATCRRPMPAGRSRRGGQVGLLGNRDFMDTPFNQTSYTREVDAGPAGAHPGRRAWPTIRRWASPGGGRLRRSPFMIRGFHAVNNQTSAFGGLYGVRRPTASIMPEHLERVEVLKGAERVAERHAAVRQRSAARSTLSRSARRTTPLNAGRRLSTLPDAQFGGTVDFGRRFGADKEIGVRFNGAILQRATRPSTARPRSLAPTSWVSTSVVSASASRGDIGYQTQTRAGSPGRPTYVARRRRRCRRRPMAATAHSSPGPTCSTDDIFGALAGRVSTSRSTGPVFVGAGGRDAASSTACRVSSTRTPTPTVT